MIQRLVECVTANPPSFVIIPLLKADTAVSTFAFAHIIVHVNNALLSHNKGSVYW